MPRFLTRRRGRAGAASSFLFAAAVPLRFLSRREFVWHCHAIFWYLCSLFFLVFAGSAHLSAGTAGAASNGFAGDGAVESANDASPAGEAEAWKTSAATGGPVQSLSVYLTSSTTASNVLIGLYADGGSGPGNLLAAGTIRSIAKDSWNSVALASPVTLTQGSTYWLALSGQGGQVAYRDRAGVGTPAQTAAGTYTALPSNWKTGSYIANDGPLSAYAGSAAAPPLPLLHRRHLRLRHRRLRRRPPGPSSWRRPGRTATPAPRPSRAAASIAPTGLPSRGRRSRSRQGPTPTRTSAPTPPRAPAVAGSPSSPRAARR